MRKILTILCVAATLAACGDKNGEKTAAALLDEARAEYAAQRYDRAATLIDSLRTAYPKAIEARKAALELHQQVELSKAQARVAEVDEKLQAVRADYERMSAEAERAKRELRATPEQLTAVTLKRIERDSLQTVYDVECAKIKYIHKRQKE